MSEIFFFFWSLPVELLPVPVLIAIVILPSVSLDLIGPFHLPFQLRFHGNWSHQMWKSSYYKDRKSIGTTCIELLKKKTIRFNADGGGPIPDCNRISGSLVPVIFRFDNPLPPLVRDGDSIDVDLINTSSLSIDFRESISFVKNPEKCPKSRKILQNPSESWKISKT